MGVNESGRIYIKYNNGLSPGRGLRLRECVCVCGVCVRDGNFVKGFLYFVKDFIILSVLFENFASRMWSCISC